MMRTCFRTLRLKSIITPRICSSRTTLHRFSSMKKNEDLTAFSQLNEVKEILNRVTTKLTRKNLFQKEQSLAQMINSPTFWSEHNSSTGNKILREYASVQKLSSQLAELKSAMEDYQALNEMKASDPEFGEEALQILSSTYPKAKELEIMILLDGEADNNGCFIEVQAGAGGRDSMDWASMLLEMYRKWGDRKNFSTQLVEQSVNESGELKSGTIKIDGDYAFGWLKRESGVHRLIRISPYDTNGKRHTSFASVFVTPITTDAVAININKADIRIDTFRSSGPGGQSVNKTDSAVRVTHIPTGITVKIQSERSQHHNKDVAMEILTSKLYEMELKKKETADNMARSVIGDNSWSNQIRTYTIHPYSLVKDARSGAETSNVTDLLEGGPALDQYVSTAHILT